jgi:hypothetical protein
VYERVLRTGEEGHSTALKVDMEWALDVQSSEWPVAGGYPVSVRHYCAGNLRTEHPRMSETKTTQANDLNQNPSLGLLSASGIICTGLCECSAAYTACFISNSEVPFMTATGE